MPIETAPFDPARYLPEPKAQAEFLTAAFERGDAAHVTVALGVVARAMATDDDGAARGGVMLGNRGDRGGDERSAFSRRARRMLRWRRGELRRLKRAFSKRARKAGREDVRH